MFTVEDKWWLNSSYVGVLIQYLADIEGYEGKDLAYAVNKPYKFSNYLNKALDYYKEEYGHLKKKEEPMTGEVSSEDKLTIDAIYEEMCKCEICKCEPCECPDKKTAKKEEVNEA